MQGKVRMTALCQFLRCPIPEWNLTGRCVPQYLSTGQCVVHVWAHAALWSVNLPLTHCKFEAQPHTKTRLKPNQKILTRKRFKENKKAETDWKLFFSNKIQSTILFLSFCSYWQARPWSYSLTAGQQAQCFCKSILKKIRIQSKSKAWLYIPCLYWQIQPQKT